MKTRLFTVTYEGYLVINATDEDSAMASANSMLSKSGIVNDGDEGEWELTGVSDEEEEY
jgi:hypothetical protein